MVTEDEMLDAVRDYYFIHPPFNEGDVLEAIDVMLDELEDFQLKNLYNKIINHE